MKKSKIFVHIPKTGGTSVNVAMEAKYNRFNGDFQYVRKKFSVKKSQLPRKEEIQINKNEYGSHSHHNIKAIYTDAELKKYDVFTVVRNPYSRLVSLFEFYKLRYLDMGNHKGTEWIGKNKLYTFNTFVTGLIDEHMCEPGIIKHQGLIEGVDLYISPSSPQVEWLDKLKSFDVKIYKFEYIKEVFSDLDLKQTHKNSTVYKFGPNWKKGYDMHAKNLLAKVRHGLNKNWKNYYTQGLLDITNKIYKDDFKLLGYNIWNSIKDDYKWQEKKCL